MKIWAKTAKFYEGKFLVIRRDGSVPAWPHFVLGARDPDAPAALVAYVSARAARTGVLDDYGRSILELAEDFQKYRAAEGDGDPEAGPHRVDDPNVIDVMRGGDGEVLCWQSKNKVK